MHNLACHLSVMLLVVSTVVFLVLYTLSYNHNVLLRNSNRVAVATTDRSNTARTMVAQQYDASTGMSRIATFAGYTSFSPFDMMIDRVYFINMDHRPDRMVQLLNELARMGISKAKIERIPGVKDKFGALGCSKAHLNALLDCKAHGYKSCMILEDDFMFKYNREFTWEQLNRFFTLNIEWDVVMLASNTLGYEPTTFDFLLKINDAQTTSGYMVHCSFLDTLLDNVRQGITQLEILGGEANCIDQYWKTLQPTSKWFVFHPVMGHQRDGFSDIMGQVTSYNDKVELFEGAMEPFEYLVCVQNCRARLGRNPDRVKDLQELCRQHPTICYYQYLGDPDLATDFSINEQERLITLRCKDDYLNLCHKFGQLLHALRNVLSLNKRFQHIRGVFFTDDDIVLTVPRFYDFLHEHQQLQYWGRLTEHGPLTHHLKDKAKESELIRTQVEAFPELLKYPVEVFAGQYCSGGGFYLRMDTLLSVSDSDDLFAPFPEDQSVLNQYKVVLDDGRMIYSKAVCVIEDLNVGTAVARLGIAAVGVDLHQIANW